MDTFDVNAVKREPTGKGALRRLKDEGFIPGVLYTDGGSIPITLEEDQMKNILNKGRDNVYLNLSFDGKPMTVKIQEVQRNPINLEDIRHIDLMPIDTREMSQTYLH